MTCLIDFNAPSGDEKFRVAQFLGTTDKIRNSDLFKDGLFAMAYNMKSDPETGAVRITLNGPTEKDIRDALLDIRKLILEREPESLSRMLNFMSNRLAGVPDVRQVKEMQIHLREVLKGRAATFKLGISNPTTAEVRTLSAERIMVTLKESLELDN